MKEIPKSLNFIIRFLIIITSVNLMSGCGGMWADSMARSWVTGESFEEMSASHPQAAAGNARVFFYRTSSSTISSLKYGVGLVKTPVLCAIDDTVYEIIWEAYRYVDLAEGKHVITCASNVKVGKKSLYSKAYFPNDTKQISLVVGNLPEIFVRVDTTSKEPPAFQPTLVDSAQARLEILKLQYQKIGGHNFTDGKISEQ